MNITRSGVELPCDGVEVILDEPGQVSAFGHHEEHVVDRLMSHPLLRLLWIKRLHRASNLFRRPRLPQEVLDHTKQRRFVTELTGLPTLQSSGSRPVPRPSSIVGLPLNPMSSYFSSNRARRSTQGLGHRPNSGAVSFHQHHCRPFLRLQLFVMFSHRNTLHCRGVALGF